MFVQRIIVGLLLRSLFIDGNLVSVCLTENLLHCTCIFRKGISFNARTTAVIEMKSIYNFLSKYIVSQTYNVAYLEVRMILAIVDE